MERERLRDHKRRPRRDAAIDRPRAGDDPRDMGSVADVVDGPGLGEIAIRDDALAEVGMAIRTGVDDPDADAATLDAAPPHRLDRK